MPICSAIVKLNSVMQLQQYHVLQDLRENLRTTLEKNL